MRRSRYQFVRSYLGLLYRTGDLSKSIYDAMILLLDKADDEFYKEVKWD